MPIGAFDIPRCYKDDLAAVVITEGLIRDRVKRLAKDIHEAIGDNQLSLLCVLKGSYKFFNALVDELSNARWACKEPMTVDFIRVKSYEDDASSGKVQIIGMSNLEELRGKNVLVGFLISVTSSVYIFLLWKFVFHVLSSLIDILCIV
ncbi:putative hypoxanthine phosphoribosyltransferase [Oesophagostomum dentatum]|uniref:Putative hypoxanthine phosphoribosyltransferase n=1 Tax=Oesophagostomum dentatum TaxID=61180 RepID=A0A0B1S765_OESDE|nr:putative hypoxanthine phosphoribosyltransferase [Oesophagostomum dentatum]